VSKILIISFAILSALCSCSIKENHDLIYEYENDKLYIQLDLNKYKIIDSFLQGDLLIENKTDEIQTFNEKDFIFYHKNIQIRADIDSIVVILRDWNNIDIPAKRAIKKDVFIELDDSIFSVDTLNQQNTNIEYISSEIDKKYLREPGSYIVKQQNPFTKYCSNIVKSTLNYQTTETMKIWNGSGDPADFEVGFDVNQYFDILTNLKTLSGYKLDYVYHHDHPRIYGYSTLDSADKILQIRDNLHNSHDDNDELEYLSYVTAVDNEKGYFDFILLYIKANQFYIWDHGLYLINDIVTSYEMLIEHESKYTSWHFNFNYSEIDILNAQDFAPKVILKPDYAEVTVVLFSIWKGVRRNTYHISRTVPHNIKLVESEMIVDRVCGVMI